MLKAWGQTPWTCRTGANSSLSIPLGILTAEVETEIRSVTAAGVDSEGGQRVGVKWFVYPDLGVSNISQSVGFTSSFALNSDDKPNGF